MKLAAISCGCLANSGLIMSRSCGEAYTLFHLETGVARQRVAGRDAHLGRIDVTTEGLPCLKRADVAYHMQAHAKDNLRED